MIEPGSFWAYYSPWFHQRIANANNFMIEPDPNNLGVGRRNFALNGMAGQFFNASIGRQSISSASFLCESDGIQRPLPVTSVDDYIARQAIPAADLLLSDIQGVELEMLQGATKSIEKRLDSFLGCFNAPPFNFK